MLISEKPLTQWQVYVTVNMRFYYIMKEIVRFGGVTDGSAMGTQGRN